MDFQRKVVIVTGAASGIGEATARAFSEHGATVVLVDRHGDKVRKVAESLPAHRTAWRKVDVSVQAEVQSVVKATVAKFGGLDVMFNNAGIMVEGPVDKVDADDWDRIFATNGAGVFYGSKAALPHLIKSKGCIVNTSSLSGLGGDRDQAAYNAVKGAVSNLTRSMAVDHARDGVRINAVCPSFTRTGLTAAAEKDPKVVKAFLDRIPMGRLGEPEDVAKVVLFLASDYAAFVTGVNLPVDGGVNASNGQPLFETG